VIRVVEPCAGTDPAAAYGAAHFDGVGDIALRTATFAGRSTTSCPIVPDGPIGKQQPCPR
jgi:hypothetical protein